MDDIFIYILVTECKPRPRLMIGLGNILRGCICLTGEQEMALDTTKCIEGYIRVDGWHSCILSASDI